AAGLPAAGLPAAGLSAGRDGLSSRREHRPGAAADGRSRAVHRSGRRAGHRDLSAGHGRSAGAARTGANAFGPSPADPQFQPYPEISPYDHRFEQHFWDTHDQLWKVETNDEDYQYFVTLEALIAELRYPGQVPVGNELAAVRFDRQTDVIGLTGAPLSDVPEFERLNSGGVRGRWGFTKADKTAFEINAWWISDRTAFETERANRVPLILAFGSRNGSLIYTFDRTPQFRYESGATGAEMLFSWSPFLRRPPFELHMVGGGRWANVQERFQFLATQVVSGTNFVTIDSKTNTHVGGPEIGIGYSFGGESLFISGRSVFGVMGNGEHISVKFNEQARQDRLLGAVQETESNGHVSPLFETQLHAELRIFGLIPVLRKLSLLEEARLRLGITYLLIGEMARPATSFEYLAFPDHPAVKSDREKWDLFTWDVGIRWDY
ncbi:MAG: hypothetical protein ACREJB_08355, partial [Planctomycetaceae bacterium]